MSAQSKPPKQGTPAPQQPRPKPKPAPNRPASPKKAAGQVVTPLDPDSEHGRAIAARWSRTLAVIEREIAQTRRAAA